MKRIFIASILHQGILGGCIVADDEGITFKTGKVTVSPALRNLEMKYQNIQGFSQKWVLFFPVFSILMKSGENERFIIFSPRRFRAFLENRLNA